MTRLDEIRAAHARAERLFTDGNRCSQTLALSGWIQVGWLLAEIERLTGEAAAERRKVGRELDTLARGLADADPTGRLGGALVASALSDIGSRLMAGMPVEDATVITVEVTP